MEKIYKENIKRAVSNEWLYMNENNIKCMSVSTIVPLRITNSEDGHTVHLDLLARKEVTNPTRIVTSTIAVKEGDKERVSCKTANDIPKDKIFAVMQDINHAVCKAPISIGDVLIENAAGTGVAVIATRDIKAV